MQARFDAAAAPVDIPALIDAHPVSRFQVGIMVLVACAVVMDGFDVQAMGFVAPAIIRSWGVDRASLGPVFGAGLLGMLFGSLALSVLADRIGRRPVLIMATLFFGLLMLVTPLAGNIRELLGLRFVTGFGLGGIMANAIALVGEYSPRRRRVSLMMWVSCGFTGGAVLGGLVSAVLIPWLGWQSVFGVGGAIPLAMVAAMLAWLPESMQFLVMRDRRLDDVRRWLARIAPTAAIGPDTRFVSHEKKRDDAPVTALFQDGRVTQTLLLWGINFTNLLNLFFLANWLPTLASAAGRSDADAALLGTALQVGGLAGTILMGPLIDRLGFHRVLVPIFVAGAIAVASIGQPGVSAAALYALVMVGGFSIVGGQPAVNALAATLYPTSLRATGIGWSLGIGRIGSIVGPVLAGHLIGLHWQNDRLFIAAAVPAALSCVMLLAMAATTAVSPSPESR